MYYWRKPEASSGHRSNRVSNVSRTSETSPKQSRVSNLFSLMVCEPEGFGLGRELGNRCVQHMPCSLGGSWTDRMLFKWRQKAGGAATWHPRNFRNWAKKKVLTVSPPLASDRGVCCPDWPVFRMFSRLPSVCRAWNAVRVPPRAQCFRRLGAVLRLSVYKT
jgi:hypothetical protein